MSSCGFPLWPIILPMRVAEVRKFKQITNGSLKTSDIGHMECVTVEHQYM